MDRGLPAIDHRPGITAPALLFWAAIVATLPVFATIVGPSLGGGAKIAHADHWLWVVLHGLAGAITLIAGFVALYMGWTRRAFAWHRHTGCTYIGAGMTMAFVSLFMSATDIHGNPALMWSTGTLSAAWLFAASMGWWRGAQRAWPAHRAWMIRSMVLTWSFVFCRLAQQVEDFEWLGSGGIAVAVWLYWLGPLLIAEAVLQWRKMGAA